MELFKLLGTIAVNNSEANQNIDDTTGKAESSKSKLSSALTGIGNVAKGIGSVATSAFKVVGGAALAVGTAVVGVTEATKEYRIEMGKLDTAFVTAGHSSKSAKKTYSELNSILGDTGQAVEAANHLALLVENEKDLQTWTDICTGVYATFGASLPIEGLTEAANETAKVGQVTGPLADALNWAGISEDAFNEKLAACSSEQERQKIIMESLNKTYKDASAQYKKTNKDVIESEKANERMADVMAKVGATCEPLVTNFKMIAAELLESLSPILETLGTTVMPMLTTGMEKLSDVLGGITSKIPGLVEKITEVSGAIIGKIKPAFEEFIAKQKAMINPEFTEEMEFWGGTAFPNMAKAMKDSVFENFPSVLDKLSTAFNNVQKILQPLVEVTLTSFMRGLTTFMGVVSDVVIPVTTFLQEAFLDISNAIMEHVQPHIEKITSAFDEFSEVVNEAINDYIVPTLQMFIATVKEVWNENKDTIDKIGNFFGAVFGRMAKTVEVLVDIFKKYLYPAIRALCGFIQDNMGTIKEWLSGFMDFIGGIIDFFTSLVNGDWSAAWQALKDTVCGLLDMIVANLTIWWEAIKGIFAPIGEWLAGIWEGIKEWFLGIWESVTGWFASAAETVKGFFVGIWNSIVEVFTGVADWVYNTIIAPVVEFFTGLWESLVSAYHTVIDPWIEIFRRLTVIAKEEVIDPIVSFFQELWQTVSGFFVNLWNDIVNIFNTVVVWIDENVIVPVVEFFKGLWQSVSSFFVNLWNDIVGIFGAVSEWWKTNVTEPIKEKFTSIWKSIKEGASNAWEGIKGVFSKVADWFKNIFSTAWQKVKDVFSAGGKIFDGIKDGIAGVFKTVVNGIIGGINKVIKVPFEAINKMLNKIRSISIVGVKPFSWIKEDLLSVPQIPKLEKGGVLEKGQVGLLEGNGAEAVVPLEKNEKWISNVSKDMQEQGVGGSAEMLSVLQEILAVLKDLKASNAKLPDALTDSIASGLRLNIDNREFARLVKVVM